MLKTWHESDFWEKFFAAEKSGNMPEIAVFTDFFQILSLVFSDYFAQRCVLATPKTWPSLIFVKYFFLAENAGNMPEIAVFADFLWILSLYFVVFSNKNIFNNIAHHQVCFNCQKNWFLKPELSKKIFEKLLINYFLLFFSNFDDHFVYFFQSQYVSYFTFLFPFYIYH